MKKCCCLLILWICLLMIGTASAEETVLVDCDQLAVKVVGFGDEWGYEMKLEIENRTDAALTVSMDSVVVNGCTADPFWAIDVAPGETKLSVVTWYALAEQGVKEVPSRIDFELRAHDSGDWSLPDVCCEAVTVYPLGADQAKLQTRVPDASDVVLIDTEAAQLVVLDAYVDDVWGYTLRVYLENRTDKSTMFAINDAMVNEQPCDPFWATVVPAGACAYKTISWLPEQFEECSIAAVEKIALKFSIYDNDDWNAPYFFRDTVTYAP